MQTAQHVCHTHILARLLKKKKNRAYKTIEDEDLKFPLIYGEGKKVG